MVADGVVSFETVAPTVARRRDIAGTPPVFTRNRPGTAVGVLSTTTRAPMRSSTPAERPCERREESAGCRLQMLADDLSVRPPRVRQWETRLRPATFDRGQPRGRLRQRTRPAAVRFLIVLWPDERESKLVPSVRRGLKTRARWCDVILQSSHRSSESVSSKRSMERAAQFSNQRGQLPSQRATRGRHQRMNFLFNFGDIKSFCFWRLVKPGRAPCGCYYECVYSTINKCRLLTVR